MHAFFFLIKKNYFWPCLMACGILVPQPGIKARPTTVKAPSPNHWTSREFPFFSFLTATKLMFSTSPNYHRGSQFKMRELGL